MKKTILILIALLTAWTTISATTPKHAAKPVIGISMNTQDAYVKVAENYIRAIEAAGGIPYPLPMSTDSAKVAEVVGLIDGLIITGGADVNPLLYGDEPSQEIGKTNTVRDKAETLLFTQARKRSIPILGICRGLQLINVLMGGTLCQDIPSQWKGGRHQSSAPVQHLQTSPKEVPTHTILVAKDSRLHDIMGCDSIAVNSFHHQCIKRPAPSLRITAYAKDGVPEAFQCDKEPNIQGVQFHPEGLYQKNVAFLNFFRDFVKQALRKR